MNESTDAQAVSRQNEPSPAPRDRPLFAHDFPQTEAIDTLLEAFEKGNYAFVRAESKRLLAAADSPEERAAASELLQRLRPDPLAIVLIAASIALLSILTVWTFAIHHH